MSEIELKWIMIFGFFASFHAQFEDDNPDLPTFGNDDDKSVSIFTTLENLETSTSPQIPDSRTLPNGMKMSELNETFLIYNSSNPYSRIVANNHTVYVLTSVQKSKNNTIFDPFTIGKVLSYLYEVAEFGTFGPPDGFTIQKFGGVIPKRQGALIFKKKEERT